MVFERMDRGLMAWHVVAFVIIAVGLGAYVMFVTAPELRDMLPAETAILDTHYLGYTHGEAETFLEAASEDAQSYYSSPRLVVDLFFAPALFLAISSLFLFLTRAGRQFSVPLPEGVRMVVVALAGAGMTADLIENITLWITLGAEHPSTGLMALGGTVTGVKFLAYTAALAALAATVILALVRGVSGQTPARA